MAATSDAPHLTLEGRKLQLMVQIAQIDDLEIINYLETLFLEEFESEPTITEEEMAMVAERLEKFRTNPSKFITLEALTAKIQNEK